MADGSKKVIASSAERRAKAEDSICESSHLVDDLGADSLDTVEIIMAIEEAFSLEIPESEKEKIRTVGDAIAYIETHAKACSIAIMTCRSAPTALRHVRFQPVI